jgi:hypothetical protein
MNASGVTHLVLWVLSQHTCLASSDHSPSLCRRHMISHEQVKASLQMPFMESRHAYRNALVQQQ